LSLRACPKSYCFVIATLPQMVRGAAQAGLQHTAVVRELHYATCSHLLSLYHMRGLYGLCLLVVVRRGAIRVRRRNVLALKLDRRSCLRLVCRVRLVLGREASRRCWVVRRSILTTLCCFFGTTVADYSIDEKPKKAKAATC
jgi:hypothetical protein